MLARMRRKGNPPTLLVGMQAGAATLENSMEVPQEAKNGATLQPNNCTTSYLSGGYKIQIQRDAYIPVFIAALSTTAQLQKEPKCASTDEWTKRMWCVFVCVCLYIIYIYNGILLSYQKE